MLERLNERFLPLVDLHCHHLAQYYRVEFTLSELLAWQSNLTGYVTLKQIAREPIISEKLVPIKLIVKQIVEGLVFLHKSNLVHGNLKSSNVFYNLET